MKPSGLPIQKSAALAPKTCESTNARNSSTKMSAIEMIPASEVTAMRQAMEAELAAVRAELAAVRAELASVRAQMGKKAKEPKASRSSSPQGSEGGAKDHDGRSDWMAAIKKTWQELAAAKGVETEGDYGIFKKAAAAAGVTYQMAMAEASRRKAEVEPPVEPKAPKEPKAAKEPKAPKAAKVAKTPEEKAKKTTNPEGPAAWNAVITATWHELAAAAGVVSEAHDEAFKKAATAAGISFGVARDEASRRRREEMGQPAEQAKPAKAPKAPKPVKPAKQAKAKAPYVPYVDDEEDDVSSVSATPGADEHTARALVFPAHEKED